MKPSRRVFLATTGAAATVPVTAAGSAFLTAEEAKLVDAVCQQILPSDDLPGAREAGVVSYIDKQLSGTLSRFAPAYRQGLAGLKDAGFLSMATEERGRFLESAEAGRVAAVPAAFVRMMVDHTMQGFLGDPKHGGNQGKAGWKMLGYSEGGHSH
jgi:gluconate 2-dehydrogenase gamma chain